MSTQRIAVILALAVSVATIAGAWAFELLGGLAPCPLCLQQRWSYYAAIPLLIVALAIMRAPSPGGPARILVGLSGLVMLTGAGLAAFHAGVEWQWWDGPSGCSPLTDLDASGTGLSDLSDVRVVRCDVAPWRLFGLSLAGYNALISLGLAALLFWAAKPRTDQGSSSVSQ